MNLFKSDGLARASVYGMRSAFRGRLLLLWILFLALPTLLVAFAQWQTLVPHLAWSVHADEWASGINVPLIGDLYMALSRESTSPVPNVGLALVLSLLLSPFLNGMLIRQLYVDRALGFRELLRAGIEEYGRMFRFLLVALIPLSIALVASAGVRKMTKKHAEAAIYSADVNTMTYVFLVIAGLFLITALTSIDSGRAQFVVDGRLRSAFKAWWRGLKLTLRRPLATLGVYTLITLLSLLLAAAFGLLRLHTPSAGFGGFVLGVIISQLIVASLAWGRIARLAGLAQLARKRRVGFGN